jgi:hypothetical protein
MAECPVSIFPRPALPLSFPLPCPGKCIAATRLALGQNDTGHGPANSTDDPQGRDQERQPRRCCHGQMDAPTVPHAASAATPAMTASAVSRFHLISAAASSPCAAGLARP